MRVLAIDSASPAPSLALLSSSGEVEPLEVEPLDASAAETLVARLDALLLRAGVALSEIDRIAVLAGPGSFTGLRAGTAFARGLARALDVPLHSFGTFEAASQALPEPPEADFHLSAGRGQVHVARRRAGVLLTSGEPVAREVAQAEADDTPRLVHHLDLVPTRLAAALASLAAAAAEGSSAGGEVVYGRRSAAEEKLVG